MERQERRLLQLFDELDKETLDLHVFFELAGGNTPEAQRGVLDSINRLTAQGWLEARGNDFYARTDAGREALQRESS